MQTNDVINLVTSMMDNIIALAIVLFVMGFAMYSMPGTLRSLMYLAKAPVSIAEVAKRDLSYLGEYSEKIRISMKYWIYGIFVYVYKHKPDMDIYATIQNWNKEQTYDPQSYISDGIEDARTLFLSDFDTARENNVPVTFKCSSSFDYHEFPGNFTNNDYINPNALVEEIDKILEV